MYNCPITKKSKVFFSFGPTSEVVYINSRSMGARNVWGGIKTKRRKLGKNQADSSSFFPSPDVGVTFQ